MKKNDRKTQISINVVSMLAAMPAGLLVGMISSRTEKELPLVFVTFLVSMAVAVVLQTAIHEAGHMVFGLLTGFRFLSYRVMSFMITMEDGKLKTGKFSIPGTLGQCLMGAPVSREKKPFYLYNAGGVIFNFIFGIIGLIVALRADSYVVAVLGAANFMYAFIMFFSNGIPYEGNVANDGANIREMKRHLEVIDVFYRMLDMNEMMLKGIRMKDVDEKMFDADEKVLYAGGLGASPSVWKEGMLMDAHRFDEAEEKIKEIFDKEYPVIRYHEYMLRLEQKYLDCLNGRFEEIRDKDLQKYVKASGRSSLSMIRYLYARALYLKDTKEAEKLKKAFEDLGARYPYRGEYLSEKELMDIAEEKICGRDR